jgi:hypothetical protein
MNAPRLLYHASQGGLVDVETGEARDEPCAAFQVLKQCLVAHAQHVGVGEVGEPGGVPNVVRESAGVVAVVAHVGVCMYVCVSQCASVSVSVRACACACVRARVCTRMCARVHVVCMSAPDKCARMCTPRACVRENVEGVCAFGSLLLFERTTQRSGARWCPPWRRPRRSRRRRPRA